MRRVPQDVLMAWAARRTPRAMTQLAIDLESRVKLTVKIVAADIWQMMKPMLRMRGAGDSGV